MNWQWISAFLVCVCTIGLGQAQPTEGVVLDSLTGKPLPFVNILLDGNPHRGVTTDFDGHFKIPKAAYQSLEFRYVGYATKILTPPDTLSFIQVEMRPVGISLGEVVVEAGENPAHRIIRRTVANKEINDPYKMSAFSYQVYDKLYLTGERPEVTDRISSPYLSDTILQPAFTKVDSLMEDSADVLDSMHIFLMETVSERFYQGPGKDKTTITASRVSGFKEPSIMMMATLLQPFAFYQDRITLAGNEFLNPLTKGSTEKYFFNVVDTIYQGVDSVFIISFHPRKGKRFSGLRGVLYINTKQYALQFVLAEPAEWQMMRVRIQQQYEWVDDQAWFPTRMYADLLMRSVAINNYYGLGIARSHIRNIQIQPEIPKKTFNHFQLEMEPQAHRKADTFWTSNRPEPLTEKEIRTYHVVDSLGEEYKIDRKLRWAVALHRGSFRTGPVEFPLNRIVRYTRYEGIRLGLGIQTNENLTKWFTAGGYGAFSFADDGLKYGGFAKVHLSKSHELDLVASYHNELFESGRPQGFLREHRGWATGDVRHYIVEDMYWENAWDVGLTGRVGRNLYLKPFIKRMKLSHPSEYELVTFRTNGLEVTRDEFYFTEIGVQARFAYREKLIKSPLGVISRGTDYPIARVNYRKGVTWWGGQEKYDLWEAKIAHHITWLQGSETEWEVRAGYASGRLPYYKLFTPPGFRSEATFYGIHLQFNTMPIHGYLTDRYISGGILHNFGQLWGGSFFFNPEWKISLAGIVGGLEEPEAHQNVEIEPLTQPYLEAGFMLDRILRINFGGGVMPSGFGVGAFYRLGPYSTKRFDENLAIRMTATF